MEDVYPADSKGKGVSQPLLIHAQNAVEDRRVDDQNEDMFSMSIGVEASSGMRELVGSPASSSTSAATGSSSSSGSPLSPQEPLKETDIPSTGKGKARDVPPTLPPLSFGTTELNYESSDWPTFSSSIPEPSSFSSSYGSVGDREPSPSTSASVAGPSSAPADILETSTALSRIPSRRRSFSSLSAHSSKRSISALSVTKANVKSSSGAKLPGNLARKLLGKQRDSPSASPTSPSRDVVLEPEEPASADRMSCLAPWTHTATPRISPLATPALEMEVGIGEFDKSFPIYYANSSSNRTVLRTKGRSYSSPLPLPVTPLDLVPVAADIFEPILQPTPNYFDEFLPMELKLRVFVSLVELREAEHQKLIEAGLWTLRNATSSKNKWVGRDRGIRELFKLSRVSKAWQRLVFDGQLWVKLDLHSFPNIPPPALERLAKVAGAFIRQLDLRGHSELDSSALQEIVDHLCTDVQPEDGPHAPPSLVRSPRCASCASGAHCGDGYDMQHTSLVCRNITSLDMSRCPNPLLSFATNPSREELRLSGLKHISDDTMEALGKAAPALEVLDLSFCRTLHNSSVEAFVSSCIMLTDHACSHLAYAVPELELLELAGIGTELRDSGLITDDVLMTSHQSPSQILRHRRSSAPQPGHALEHLIISYATEVTNVAVRDLIENCTRLRASRWTTPHIGARRAGLRAAVRERKAADAQIVAVDCRGISERCVRELAPQTRPRVGWRSYDARKLGFLDGRDEEGLGVGQDELDQHRVALKTFFSWQTVDAVRAAREKKRKSTRRGLNASSSSTEEGGHRVGVHGGGRRRAALGRDVAQSCGLRSGEGWMYDYVR
ncbi:uncharacterized protein B0H18DRAFT_953464 [Fomitopsis serialis]|uniref:uncharacterized protein n=1 Tax=Fomitopsis serialis TaxID=139415 RepID=UPI0020075069|nr:uncharacterized protein B0H18DRAFT_953464 [Neoantrodia serialis]KAH9929755.1 hypothetical protein B0H18DRAFT_953464 [Neoantrodia serialis]